MGDLTATTDPLGRTRGTRYDLDQRPTAEVAADGVVTERRYDAVGNLTAVARNRRGDQPPGADVNVTPAMPTTLATCSTRRPTPTAATRRSATTSAAC